MYYQIREILDSGEQLYTIVFSPRGSGKRSHPLPSVIRELVLQQSKPLIEVIVPKVHPIYECAYTGTIEIHCQDDFTKIGHNLFTPINTVFDKIQEWVKEGIRKEKRHG